MHHVCGLRCQVVNVAAAGRSSPSGAAAGANRFFERRASLTIRRSGPLQVLDQSLCGDPRHHLVRVVHALPAVEPEGEG